MKIFTPSGLFGRAASFTQNRRSAKARHKRPFAARLRFDALEDRVVLATFTVNTLADTVDINPAVTSLRDAITDANSQAGDDIINFSITGTINLTGALPDLSSNIQIEGPGAASLMVRRDTGGDYRIFAVVGGPTVVLDGLTISNGLDSTNGGGGIYNDGTLTVSNSTVSGNSASSGGGIENYGTLTVDSSTLSGNSASASDAGGGIFNWGTLTVQNSTLSGNSAGGVPGSNGWGGGILNSNTLTVDSSTLSGNSASYEGGGIFNRAGSAIVRNSTLSNNSGGYDGGGILNIATLTVDNSTFSGNSAAFGAGISNNVGLCCQSATATVDNSTFSGNSASNSGGGIVNGGGGTLTVDSSTFSGNSASFGGGIANGWSGNPGTATVQNSTLSGNSAGYGGGIVNYGTLTVDSSTLSGNLSGYNAGGGIYSDSSGTSTLNNTVVAANHDDRYGYPDDIDGTVASSSSHNLIGVDTNLSGISNGSNGNQIGTAAAPINPMLGSLQDNGGPTETMALLPGSPAIDAGDNTLIPAGVTTDQRGTGYARIENGTVDIGAFEVQSFATTTALTSAANPSIFGQPVAFTATVSSAAGTPDGTVEYLDGSLLLGSESLVAGVAQFATSSLTAGDHQITALYDGDTAFVSSSAVLTQTVNKANPVATWSAPAAITYGTPLSATQLDALASVPGSFQYTPGMGTILHAGPGQALSALFTPADTADYNSASAAVTIDVNKANTSTMVATSGSPSVHGQAVTFTATVSVVSPGSTAVAFPAGSVTFYDNGTSIGTGTLSVAGGQDVANYTTSALSTATHPITAAFTTGDGNFNASPVSAAVTQVVNKDSTTTTASALPSSANLGQTVTFTAMVSANAPGSGMPTGTVDFLDTTTSTDLTPGGVALASGTATLSTTTLASGPHTIDAIYSGDGNFLSSSVYTGTVTIGQSIIVLDPSAGGALTLAGNATIKIPGGVFVNSSSSTALSASGNAQIKATVIDVHGGVQKSGNASFSPAPTTGAAITPDPYASLASPSTSGMINYGSESLSGNATATIKPGIYSQISVAGNASLTLSSGIYIIEGDGLSVSGNASVTGSGITIFNAGSKYPTTGGTYGTITLSGNGSYNLSPPTSGTYAGIVIFQSRDNSKALTLSGNASGMTGTIYAPAAQLAESGNSQLNASVDVDTLTISGNGVANGLTLGAPTGTVAYTPAQIRAAYGINALALDGTGQTIAIVDAYDDPSINQALDAFDSQFGLTSSGPTLYSQYGPASSFLTVLNQNGQATSLPGTDPNGPGTDNWEVEESLDVEWAHAIAPGAQIILVEANSQSLSDLMAGVATAAGQPGVSVVSMSWGFPEGQAVLASDEATYDRVFTTPGVTFVASTGDYGAADPEYPAYSPHVVAVGGTSLALNANGSYNIETGWGYDSNSLGTFIGSGGGISLYEPEPAYQHGVQSTGGRSTPDVSLVADPATGAWIADPYNLDPSNPFEVVGGTSLSAPAWAGLLALVNQGRAAAGKSPLNSSSPTETQQALYMLPQSDYNVIAGGTNGYSAGAGYNLVTGLGTPVANLLVPDLVGYQGPSTTYAGPAVGALQHANLVNTGAVASGPIDVFSVFDSLTVASNGLGDAQGQVSSTDLSSPMNQMLVPAAAGRFTASPLIAAGFVFGPVSNLSPAGLMPLPVARVTIAPASPVLMARQPASSPAQPVVNTPTISEHFFLPQPTDHDSESVPFLTRLRSGRVPDSVLDELASERVGRTEDGGRVGRAEGGGERAEETGDRDFLRPPFSALRPPGVVAGPALLTGPMPQQDPPRQSAEPKAFLTDILLAAGFCSFGAATSAARNRRAGSQWKKWSVVSGR